jgi:hypothetical protein
VRIVWAAAVASAVVCAGAALAGAAGRTIQVDYGVRLVGPVDDTGTPTRMHVTAGVPFFVRVELFTDTSTAASVAYDVDLPTGVRVTAKPFRLRTGAVTSSCLRACTVGWNAARSRRLSVYYALVTPGPGEFIVEARLVSTDRSDARRADNSGSATMVAVRVRLTLGQPLLESGPPVAGHAFEVAVPVVRSGIPIRPTGGRCVAAIGDRSLGVVISVGQDGVRCQWTIPRGSAGKTLRTTVGARKGALRVSSSWLYAIRAS